MLVFKPSLTRKRFLFSFIQGESGDQGLPGQAGMRGADVRLLYL